MEPTILIVGRLQTTLEILAEELEKFGRKILASSEKEKIAAILKDEHVDFVAIGAGLPEEQRDNLVAFMKAQNATVPIQLLQRTADASPAKMLHFVNDLAIIFKIHTAMEIKPFSNKMSKESN